MTDTLTATIAACQYNDPKFDCVATAAVAVVVRLQVDDLLGKS